MHGSTEIIYPQDLVKKVNKTKLKNITHTAYEEIIFLANAYDSFFLSLYFGFI